ncbi:hypothetical protein Q8A67_023371 [Cirrhinus molitorella]|uniref:Uncharacterized protein n=1 Tax=Cirrhinus molitorella TaxID=172907 RepID=A0AA88P3C2_9TELE|nr:hypothetical protein Q8A67_023371 [Cirrhinus molitorella]
MWRRPPQAPDVFLSFLRIVPPRPHVWMGSRKRSGEFSGQTIPGPDAGGPVGRGSGREEGPHVHVGECGPATAAGREDRPCEEDKRTLIPSHTRH